MKFLFSINNDSNHKDSYIIKKKFPNGIMSFGYAAHIDIAISVILPRLRTTNQIS